MPALGFFVARITTTISTTDELEKSKADVATHLTKISTLEETIHVSDLHVNKMVEDAVSDMKLQLNESRKQADNSNELAKHLKGTFFISTW